MNALENLAIAYSCIRKHYGDDKAKRSKVSLINHIDEGLRILDALNADATTQAAFCIHPMTQDPLDLKKNWENLYVILGSEVLSLAVDYAVAANSWLSDKVYTENECVKMRTPPPKVHGAVKELLIADKVQNYLDFWIYHLDTHPRAQELDFYFTTWLNSLDVDEVQYRHLAMRAKCMSESYGRPNDYVKGLIL